MKEPKVYPSGDQALTLQFGNAVDPVINDQVRALAEAITHKKIPGVLELVPTFCSLTVYYDPLTIKYGSLAMEIRRLAAQAETAEEKSGRLLKIPCCYGARFGPDLADMEKHTGLDRDEIIAIHSSTDYKVYMLGFLPGFVYLGGPPAVGSQTEDPKRSCGNRRQPDRRLSSGFAGRMAAHRRHTRGFL